MCQLPWCWTSCSHMRQAAHAVLHFVVDGHLPPRSPKGFCLWPVEPKRRSQAFGKLTQGRRERKSLSSVKSLWDRQHPAKLSRCVMVLAGLVQGKRWPGGLAAEPLPGTLPAGWASCSGTGITAAGAGKNHTASALHSFRDINPNLKAIQT